MATPTSSLVSRLVRAAALWTIPALLIASIGLTWFYRTTVYRSFDDPLESAVTALVASAEVLESGQVVLTRQPIDPRYQLALSGRYWMVAEVPEQGDPRLILASRSLYGETIPILRRDLARLADGSGEAIRFSSSGPDTNEPLRVIGRQVQLAGLEAPIVVMAGADRRPATRSIQQFAGLAFFLLLLLVGGLISAIYAQVRLGLRPLFDLRDRVASVREGRSQRVDGSFPAEIEPLAEELNSLIRHNRTVVERAQTHVGNLAHGLKTPLAVLQNETGRKSGVPTDIVRRQTDAMRQQIDHHLRRARAAARGQSIGLSTEIDPIISGIARTLPRIYREKDLEIETVGDTGLKFRGDGRDLEDMVGNVMDNAAKWSRRQVRVTTRDSGGRVQIVIEDDGPGIAEDMRDTALKRGARLDEQTPGSGLGLAIVGDLVEAYGGRLTLSDSTLGGLKVDIELPLSPA